MAIVTFMKFYVTRFTIACNLQFLTHSPDPIAPDVLRHFNTNFGGNKENGLSNMSVEILKPLQP